MTTISDIRRARLAEIVERDTLTAAASRFKKPDSQISDMLKKRKSFGEKVARAMEAAYAPDRSPGWLDIDTGAAALDVRGSPKERRRDSARKQKDARSQEAIPPPELRRLERQAFGK